MAVEVGDEVELKIKNLSGRRKFGWVAEHNSFDTVTIFFPDGHLLYDINVRHLERVKPLREDLRPWFLEALFELTNHQIRSQVENVPSHLQNLLRLVQLSAPLDHDQFRLVLQCISDHRNLVDKSILNENSMKAVTRFDHILDKQKIEINDRNQTIYDLSKQIDAYKSRMEKNDILINELRSTIQIMTEERMASRSIQEDLIKNWSETENKNIALRKKVDEVERSNEQIFRAKTLAEEETEKFKKKYEETKFILENRLEETTKDFAKHSQILGEKRKVQLEMQETSIKLTLQFMKVYNDLDFIFLKWDDTNAEISNDILKSVKASVQLFAE